MNENIEPMDGFDPVDGEAPTANEPVIPAEPEPNEPAPPPAPVQTVFNYLQIAGGVIIGASQLSGPVVQADMIEWPTFAPELVGKLYDPETGEISDPPAPPADLRITVLAAINRFTEDEWLDIDLFSINDPSLTAAQRRVQAKIRLFMLKLTSARYVDLADPAVSEGMAGLVAAGLITEDRADEILNTPPAAHELWASNTAMRATAALTDQQPA